MFQEFQLAPGLVPGGAFQLEGLAGEAHDRQLGINRPQTDDDQLRQQAELVRQAFRGQVGRRKAASGEVNWQTEVMRERARHASSRGLGHPELYQNGTLRLPVSPP